MIWRALDEAVAVPSFITDTINPSVIVLLTIAAAAAKKRAREEFDFMA